MNSVVRRAWERMRVSLADEVHGRSVHAEKDSAEREAEMLRQMGDVFSEMNRLAVTLGDLHNKVDELSSRLDGLSASFDGLKGSFDGLKGSFDGLGDRFKAELDELRDVVGVLAESDNQSEELLGRLLASTRSRLEVVEEAVLGS